VCCGFLFVGVVFFLVFGLFFVGIVCFCFVFCEFYVLWGLIVRCECVFAEAGFCLNDLCAYVCVGMVCVCVGRVFVLAVCVLCLCWF